MSRPGVAASDLVRLGLFGLRTRPTRVVLSALGIAIGIAAMVAVVGLGSSSQAQLQGVLDRLGTNLLVAAPGKQVTGETVPLPREAVGQVARLGHVTSAAGAGTLEGAHVYRTDHVPPLETKGLDVMAAIGDLPTPLGATLSSGRWLLDTGSREADSRDAGREGVSLGTNSSVVLGAAAATALGLDSVSGDKRVWIGGSWWSVVGILDPLPLAPDLDTTAFVPRQAAEDRLGFDGEPTRIYARADPQTLDATRSLLSKAVNPEHPDGVAVKRPSDALEAAPKSACDGLSERAGVTFETSS